MVRELLSHRAGLPAVRERLPDDALYDWQRMTGALADQKPYWAPGRDHGYHVNTFGFLVGELVRRATGLPVGVALERHVTGPLDTDFYFGVPSDRHHRIACGAEDPASRVAGRRGCRCGRIPHAGVGLR